MVYDLSLSIQAEPKGILKIKGGSTCPQHPTSAQCFYREGHAYIVKNPMVCLMGLRTKFFWVLPATQ